MAEKKESSSGGLAFKFKRKASKKAYTLASDELPSPARTDDSGNSTPSSTKSATLPSGLSGASALPQSQSEGIFSKLRRKFRLGSSKGRYDLKSQYGDPGSPGKPWRVRRKSDEPRVDSLDMREEEPDFEGRPVQKAQSVKTQRRSRSDKEEVVLIRKDKRVSIMYKAEDGTSEMIFSNMDNEWEDEDSMNGGEEDPYSTISNVREEQAKAGLTNEVKKRKKEQSSPSPCVPRVLSDPQQSGLAGAMPQSALTKPSPDDYPYAKIDPNRRKAKSVVVRPSETSQLPSELSIRSSAGDVPKYDPDYESLDEVKAQKDLVSQRELPQTLNIKSRNETSPTRADLGKFDPDYECLDEVRQRVSSNLSASRPQETEVIRVKVPISPNENDTIPSSSEMTSPGALSSLADSLKDETNGYDSGEDPYAQVKDLTPQLFPSKKGQTSPKHKNTGSKPELPSLPIRPTSGILAPDKKLSNQAAVAPLAPSIDSALPPNPSDQQKSPEEEGEAIYDNPNVIIRKRQNQKQNVATLESPTYSQPQTSRRSGTLTENSPNTKTLANEELIEKLILALAPPLPLRNYEKDEAFSGPSGLAASRHSWACQSGRGTDFSGKKEGLKPLSSGFVRNYPRSAENTLLKPWKVKHQASKSHEELSSYVQKQSPQDAGSERKVDSTQQAAPVVFTLNNNAESSKADHQGSVLNFQKDQNTEHTSNTLNKLANVCSEDQSPTDKHNHSPTQKNYCKSSTLKQSCPVVDDLKNQSEQQASFLSGEEVTEELIAFSHKLAEDIVLRVCKKIAEEQKGIQAPVTINDISENAELGSSSSIEQNSESKQQSVVQSSSAVEQEDVSDQLSSTVSSHNVLQQSNDSKLQSTLTSSTISDDVSNPQSTLTTSTISGDVSNPQSMLTSSTISGDVSNTQSTLSSSTNSGDVLCPGNNSTSASDEGSTPCISSPDLEDSLYIAENYESDFKAYLDAEGDLVRNDSPIKVNHKQRKSKKLDEKLQSVGKGAENLDAQSESQLSPFEGEVIGEAGVVGCSLSADSSVVTECRVNKAPSLQHCDEHSASMIDQQTASLAHPQDGAMAKVPGLALPQDGAMAKVPGLALPQDGAMARVPGLALPQDGARSRLDSEPMHNDLFYTDFELEQQLLAMGGLDGSNLPDAYVQAKEDYQRRLGLRWMRAMDERRIAESGFTPLEPGMVEGLKKVLKQPSSRSDMEKRGYYRYSTGQLLESSSDTKGELFMNTKKYFPDDLWTQSYRHEPQARPTPAGQGALQRLRSEVLEPLVPPRNGGRAAQRRLETSPCIHLSEEKLEELRPKEGEWVFRILPALCKECAKLRCRHDFEDSLKLGTIRFWDSDISFLRPADKEAFLRFGLKLQPQDINHSQVTFERSEIVDTDSEGESDCMNSLSCEKTFQSGPLIVKKSFTHIISLHPRLLENTISGLVTRDTSIDKAYLEKGIFKWSRWFDLPEDTRDYVETKLKYFFIHVRTMTYGYIQGWLTPALEREQRNVDRRQRKFEKRLKRVSHLPMFQDVRNHLTKSLRLNLKKGLLVCAPATKKKTVSSHGGRATPEGCLTYDLTLTGMAANKSERAEGEEVCASGFSRPLTLPDLKSQSSVSTKSQSETEQRRKKHYDPGAGAGPSQADQNVAKEDGESSDTAHTPMENQSAGICQTQGVNVRTPGSPPSYKQWCHLVRELKSLCGETSTPCVPTSPVTPSSPDSPTDSNAPAPIIHIPQASDYDSDSEDELITMDCYSRRMSLNQEVTSMCRSIHGELAYPTFQRPHRPEVKMLRLQRTTNDCPGVGSHINYRTWVELDSLFRKLVLHISPRLNFSYLLKTYEEFKYFVLSDRKKNYAVQGCYNLDNKCCRFQEYVHLKLLRDEIRHFCRLMRHNPAVEILIQEEKDIAQTLVRLMHIILSCIHKIKLSLDRVRVSGMTPVNAQPIRPELWEGEWRPLVFRHAEFRPWFFMMTEDLAGAFHIENHLKFFQDELSHTLRHWKSPDAMEAEPDPNCIVSSAYFYAHTRQRPMEVLGMHMTCELSLNPRPLQLVDDFKESMQQLQWKEWYWGPITYEQAACVLKDKEDGSFLVRDSSDRRYLLSLSFKSLGQVHHTRIEHAKGLFSFYQQPESHGKARICEFIEKSIQNSRDGRFLYFLRPRAQGTPPLPIRLLTPVSRNLRVPSLQHLSRFIVRQTVRKDHIDRLPVPEKVKNYLLDKQYYVEAQEGDLWTLDSY